MPHALHHLAQQVLGGYIFVCEHPSGGLLKSLKTCRDFSSSKNGMLKPSNWLCQVDNRLRQGDNNNRDLGSHVVTTQVERIETRVYDDMIHET